MARLRARVEAQAREIDQRLTARDPFGLYSLGRTLVERDQEVRGSVTGSAAAFRLFLFMVPFVLLTVGILGLLGRNISHSAVSRDIGVTGNLAEQIHTALSQSGRGSWAAIAFGLSGVLTAGRALTKVLTVASAAAWRVPVRRAAALRVVAIVVVMAMCVASIAALSNRLRVGTGAEVAWLAYLPAAIIYAVAWLLVLAVLPRGTNDMSALLPAAALFGLTLAGMEAVTQLYLPSRFQRASALYGSIGVAVVTLGWFFILGRVVVWGMSLNAVIAERIGTANSLVFSLPLLRELPRRWPRLAERLGIVGGPEPPSPSA